MSQQSPSVSGPSPISGASAASNEVEALQQTFARCSDDIEERIRAIRRSTESEVLAIGQCVQTIVEEAKAYVAHIDERQRARANSESLAAAMVKEMVSAVQKQEETVEKAIAQSSAILRAGRDVQAMASATRLLSLNARVEASRLGDQGSSFSVIADEMRQLSVSVKQTNTEVATMAKELQHLLPSISEQVRAMHQQFKRFAAHVDQQISLDRRGDDDPIDGHSVVERIMTSAYDALSHLAFQDPMAQSLELVNRSMAELGAHIDHLSPQDGAVPSKEAPASGADRSAATTGSPGGEESGIEAGEVLLF